MRKAFLTFFITALVFSLSACGGDQEYSAFHNFADIFNEITTPDITLPNTSENTTLPDESTQPTIDTTVPEETEPTYIVETLPEFDSREKSYNVIVQHSDGTKNFYYLYTDKAFLGEALESEGLIKRTENRIVMFDGNVINPVSNWSLQTADPVDTDYPGETEYSKPVYSAVGIDQAPVVDCRLYIISETSDIYEGPDLADLNLQSKVILIKQQNFNYYDHFEAYYVLESDGSCCAFLPITGEWWFSVKGSYTISDNLLSFHMTDNIGSIYDYSYQYNAAFGVFIQTTQDGLCNADEACDSFTVTESNEYTIEQIKSFVNTDFSESP